MEVIRKKVTEFIAGVAWFIVMSIILISVYLTKKKK